MVKCDGCPWFNDTYPGKLDNDGYHFGICGMTGNKVYPKPHRIKRMTGRGYLKFGGGSCGIFDTIEDVLNRMTDSERKRWEERQNENLNSKSD